VPPLAPCYRNIPNPAGTQKGLGERIQSDLSVEGGRRISPAERIHCGWSHDPVANGHGSGLDRPDRTLVETPREFNDHLAKEVALNAWLVVSLDCPGSSLTTNVLPVDTRHFSNVFQADRQNRRAQNASPSTASQRHYLRWHARCSHHQQTKPVPLVNQT
jgi:hypothetical protein